MSNAQRIASMTFDNSIELTDQESFTCPHFGEPCPHAGEECEGRCAIEESQKPKIFAVAVFMCDRAYGGGEEGGWWFDCGEPASEMVQFTRVFRNEKLAYAYRDRLDRKLIAHLNKGRRDINSVLSEGEYRAVLTDGPVPLAFPERRPHYE